MKIPIGLVMAANGVRAMVLGSRLEIKFRDRLYMEIAPFFQLMIFNQ
jgi:hypothetical protein